jgi:hypothetical protein
VTENHLGHALKEIEIVHQERHKVISETVKEIHNLIIITFRNYLMVFSEFSTFVNYLARVTKIFQTIDAVPLYRIGIVT